VERNVSYLLPFLGYGKGMTIICTNKRDTGKEQGRKEGRRHIGCPRRKGQYSGRP
jgi:hypothetical protein